LPAAPYSPQATNAARIDLVRVRTYAVHHFADNAARIWHQVPWL
jgi:hypothetical protein